MSQLIKDAFRQKEAQHRVPSFEAMWSQAEDVVAQKAAQPVNKRIASIESIAWIWNWRIMSPALAAVILFMVYLVGPQFMSRQSEAERVAQAWQEIQTQYEESLASETLLAKAKANSEFPDFQSDQIPEKAKVFELFRSESFHRAWESSYY